MTSAFLSALLEANIAAAAAIAVILLARKAVRTHLGPRAAYLIWLAVPAAILATFLPPRTDIAMRPAIDLAGDISGLASTPHAAALPFDWAGPLTVALGLVWLAGAIAMTLFLGRRQVLFLGDVARGLAGPAVVGFQKPRIVTPDDFDRRFSPAERRLILAHETIHLERHDARINALIALARCLCWFNPLIHVGAHVLRIDQELSCDAAVIERRPRARRAYAETLLKTQLASRPLPVGCYWPGTTKSNGTDHPLTERIAMLTRRPLSQRRRFAATAAVLLLAGAGGVAAWAAQPPSTVEVLQASPSDDGEMLVAVQPIGRAAQAKTLHEDPPPASPDNAAPQRLQLDPGAFYAKDGDVKRPFPGKDFAKPDYPELSQANHEEGDVTVQLCVAATGDIESAKLIRSSGFQRLDDVTVNGLPKTKLQPATYKGKPVAVCGYMVTIVWRMEDIQPQAPATAKP